MKKLTTRNSSRNRNRTAADLGELDRQFKNWLDSLAASLGQGAQVKVGGAMMVGGEPVGMGIIVNYQPMPEGTKIMVDAGNIDGDVASMSLMAVFKDSWAKQVAKYNTGNEDIMVRGMVRMSDPSKARNMVESFVEATRSVVLSASKQRYFGRLYDTSASLLRDFLGNVLVRGKLASSSSDVVLKPNSHVAVVESGAPYGVGSVLVKGVLSRAINSYMESGKPVPKKDTLKKTILSKIDKMVGKALGDFKTSSDIISTYLRPASWKGDDVEVSFMLNYQIDGAIRPPHLMAYIASSGGTQIRLAYAQLMYRKAAQFYILKVSAQGRPKVNGSEDEELFSQILSKVLGLPVRPNRGDIRQVEVDGRMMSCQEALEEAFRRKPDKIQKIRPLAWEHLPSWDESDASYKVEISGPLPLPLP